MERHERQMELVRVWRGARFADTTTSSLETGRPNVQQVRGEASHFNLVNRLVLCKLAIKEYQEGNARLKALKERHKHHTIKVRPKSSLSVVSERVASTI